MKTTTTNQLKGVCCYDVNGFDEHLKQPQQQQQGHHQH
jgi:hypothetical protein